MGGGAGGNCDGDSRTDFRPASSSSPSLAREVQAKRPARPSQWLGLAHASVINTHALGLIRWWRVGGAWFHESRYRRDHLPQFIGCLEGYVRGYLSRAVPRTRHWDFVPCIVWHPRSWEWRLTDRKQGTFLYWGVEGRKEEPDPRPSMDVSNKRVALFSSQHASSMHLP
jgi:hypothetical protein